MNHFYNEYYLPLPENSLQPSLSVPQMKVLFFLFMLTKKVKKEKWKTHHDPIDWLRKIKSYFPFSSCHWYLFFNKTQNPLRDIIFFLNGNYFLFWDLKTIPTTTMTAMWAALASHWTGELFSLLHLFVLVLLLLLLLLVLLLLLPQKRCTSSYIHTFSVLLAAHMFSEEVCMRCRERERSNVKRERDREMAKLRKEGKRDREAERNEKLKVSERER